MASRTQAQSRLGGDAHVFSAAKPIERLSLSHQALSLAPALPNSIMHSSTDS